MQNIMKTALLHKSFNKIMMLQIWLGSDCVFASLDYHSEKDR